MELWFPLSSSTNNLSSTSKAASLRYLVLRFENLNICECLSNMYARISLDYIWLCCNNLDKIFHSTVIGSETALDLLLQIKLKLFFQKFSLCILLRATDYLWQHQLLLAKFTSFACEYKRILNLQFAILINRNLHNWFPGEIIEPPLKQVWLCSIIGKESVSQVVKNCFLCMRSKTTIFVVDLAQIVVKTILPHNQDLKLSTLSWKVITTKPCELSLLIG